MCERATLEEVLEFANKVREAGGGNPIDALMPGIPEEPESCLIANNLNFNCRVQGADLWDTSSESSTGKFREYGYSESPWFMHTTAEIGKNIGEKLGLEYIVDEKYDKGEVLLPAYIGQVAADFDEWTFGVNDEFEDYIEPHYKSHKAECILEDFGYGYNLEMTKEEFNNLVSKLEENSKFDFDDTYYYEVVGQPED